MHNLYKRKYIGEERRAFFFLTKTCKSMQTVFFKNLLRAPTVGQLKIYKKTLMYALLNVLENDVSFGKSFTLPKMKGLKPI